MKKQKALKIIELALIFLTVLFVILKNVWSGFSVIAIVLMLLAFCGAAVLAVMQYLEAKAELKLEFDDYLFDMWREEKITKEQLDQKDDSLYKQFLKENRWELYRYFVFVALCAAIVVSVLVAII